MFNCTFERSSGLFITSLRWRDVPHDPVTHIQLKLEVSPDRRTDRWDGALGVRSATSQELTDFDDVLAETDAANTLDAAINKTLRDLFLDIEQRFRAVGQTSTLPDIAAANTKSEYTAALKARVKTYLYWPARRNPANARPLYAPSRTATFSLPT